MSSPKLWIYEVKFKGDGDEVQTLTVKHFGDKHYARQAASDEAQHRLVLGEAREATQAEYQLYYAEERLNQTLDDFYAIAIDAIDYVGAANYAGRERYAKGLVRFFRDHQRVPTDEERDKLKISLEGE